MIKAIHFSRKIQYLYRNISTVVALHKDDTAPPKRKVTETVELVTLVDQNDKILGLKPKTESEKLAQKLNLSLERVYDTKYGKMHSAYKLVSPSDLLKEVKKASAAKVLKRLPINYRINDNDLTTKIKMIKKWLTKNCEVHVHILGNNEVESQKKAVFSKIQEQLKSESRTIDIRYKEDGIKFIIIPPKIIKHNPKNELSNPVDS